MVIFDLDVLHSIYPQDSTIYMHGSGIFENGLACTIIGQMTKEKGGPSTGESREVVIMALVIIRCIIFMWLKRSYTDVWILGNSLCGQQGVD